MLPVFFNNCNKLNSAVFLPEIYTEALGFTSRFRVLQLISVLLYLSSFSFIFFLFIICLPLNLLNYYYPDFYATGYIIEVLDEVAALMDLSSTPKPLIICGNTVTRHIILWIAATASNATSCSYPCPPCGICERKVTVEQAPCRHRLPARQAG